MLMRTWRDVGVLVSVALAGAAVALYAEPPLTRFAVGSGIIWLVIVGASARYAAHCATGRGVIGTPERNADYHADPERFALGGMRSFGVGTGLGMMAMLVAIAARSF